MSTSLPLQLIVAWVLLFGFINTHQRHASSFRGASQGYHFALQASVLVGTVAGFGLLIYYFIQVSWYWPLVLFAVGSLAGGLIFGVLDAKVGQLIMSTSAFIGWPVAAVWAYVAIRGINP